MSTEDRQKWDQIHRGRGFFPTSPSSLLTAKADYLPAPDHAARAIDIAGGSGRHALWMAEHGFDATLLDISEVGLQIAREEADARGLHIATVCADLEEQPLPTGPWHVILSFHYLQRSLITQFATQLAPGGVLFFVQPTVRNLERHDRPSQRFLLYHSSRLYLWIGCYGKDKFLDSPPLQDFRFVYYGFGRSYLGSNLEKLVLCSSIVTNVA